MGTLPVRDSVEGVLDEMRRTVAGSPPVGFTRHFWLDAMMHRLVRVLSYEVEDARDRADLAEILKLYEREVLFPKTR